MRNSFFRLCCLLAGLFLAEQLPAQQIEVEPQIEAPEYDWKPSVEDAVSRQDFDEAAHASLLRELDYSGEPKARQSRQQQRRRNNRSRSGSGNSGGSSSDWQIGEITLSNTAFIIIACLLIAALGYFLYLYFEMADKRAKNREAADLQLELEEIEEEKLTLQQTETLLERAERLGDFTTAVRLQYLALLKQLQDLGLIQYQRDKTDREYRREMDRTELGDVFSEITIDYARNWYGQYPLDRLSYRLVADRVERLRQHLSTQSAPAYV